MGLKEILEEIGKESDERALTVINEAKVKAAQIVAQKIDELEEYYRKKREAFMNDIEREERKVFAKVELDAQKELNIIDNEIIETTLSEAFTEIVDRLKKDEKLYLSFLQRMVEQAVKVLGKKEGVVSLNSDDANLFKKLSEQTKVKITLGEPAHIRAGIICSAKDSPVFIDNSLASILRDLKPEFIRLIVSELAQK